MTYRLHKLWDGSDAYELVGSSGVVFGLIIPIRRWDLRGDAWETEWVLGGWWSPNLTSNNTYPSELRDMRSPAEALLAGCARAGIAIADVEGNQDTVLVMADAKGRDRLSRHEPEAGIRREPLKED